MPPTRVNLCLFSLVASCQEDHRARVALGRCNKGGSGVQIAGLLHCELVSHVPFLGEGVMEAAE